MGFSEDGMCVFARNRDRSDSFVAWDVLMGEVIEREFSTAPMRIIASKVGLTRLVRNGNNLEVICHNPEASRRIWVDETARHAWDDPDWHLKNARTNGTLKNWFAARFHIERLLQLADAVEDESRSYWKGWLLYSAARSCAVCVKALTSEEDQQLSYDEESLRLEFFNQTISHLNEAVAAGYTGRIYMTDDSDLAVLLELPIESLLELFPDNVQFQSEVGVAFSLLGHERFRLEQYNDAAEQYLKALAFYERLALNTLDERSPQENLAIACENLANTYLRQSNTKDALNFHERELAVRNRIIQLVPDAVELQEDLSLRLIRYGDLALEAGDLAAASSFFGRNLELLQSLAKRLPDNSRYQSSLSDANIRLGKVKLQQAAQPEAIQLFAEAVKIREQRFNADVENSNARDRLIYSLGQLAIGNAQLGKNYQKQNQLKESASLYEKAVSIRERVVKLDPEDAAEHQRLSILLTEAGDACLKNKDPDMAIQYFLRKSEVAETLAKQHPENSS